MGVAVADSPVIQLEEGKNLARLESMDGSPFPEPVSSTRWKQAIFELRRSAKVDPEWPNPRTLVSRQRKQSEWAEIPLMLLHAAYRRPDAIASDQAKEVFAVTSLRENIYHGSGLRFVVRHDNILTLGVPGIESMLLDAGDGNGFRPLRPDQALNVSYQGIGSKTLTLQVTLSDGRTLWSSTQLEVVAATTPDPDATWMVAATEPFDGSFGTGQAYIYLAEGHATLTNPVIVVEGFDIDNSIDWPVLYNLLNRENMLEDIRAAGYDAVVLDFTEAVDPIQRNAFVLTRLLEMVRSELAAEQSIALIGASMGGLVSRYALLWQEQQAIDSRIRNFISFDSPHGGANIPLGLQEWVDFFSGSSDEASFLKERLNAPASRQMLLYHLLSRSGTSANPDPLKTSLDLELTAMGAWPGTPRLVSIINGSGSMSGQGFNPGEQILQYEYDSPSVKITGNVWALPQSSDPQTTIFDGLTQIVFSSSSREVQIQNSVAWDNAPGGSRATMQQAADSAAPYGDIVALHDSHSFVPSVSALALQGAAPFYDIAGDPDLLESTPFDQVYFPVQNQEHIDVNAQNKAWFLSEIAREICSYSISPANSSFPVAGGSDSFAVIAETGCGWTPTKSVSWITLHSGADSGSGTVFYAVAPNTGNSSRTGTITVQGKTYSITQSDVDCSYSISPPSDLFAATGGSGSFAVTAPTGCGWAPAKSVSWITLNSGADSGNGTVSYTVAANKGSSSRSDLITVQDKSHSIEQQGIPTPAQTCNINTISGVTEDSVASHEACETLIVGPNVTAKDGASLKLSSGLDIELLPGFSVEPGASLDADICGHSLCETSPSPMPYGCHSCVDQICDTDPSCCYSGFDQACLDKVETVCGLTCESE